MDFNSGNSRNGVYSRILHTEYGDLEIAIPRDRNGDFKQQIVAPYKRSNDTLESFVIHMFQKEVTISEISHLIERMYGHHDTPQTISNMTQAVTEEVEAFRQRSLFERYVCVYLDATFLPVKRETVSEEAVYIAVDIREVGSKGVLSYTVALTESAHGACRKSCSSFLMDSQASKTVSIRCFQKRNTRRVSFTLHATFLAGSVLSGPKEICEDLKSLYRATDKADAEQALDTFIEKWKKSYTKVTQSLKDNPDLFAFYDFPEAIRRSIYFTNLIELFNKRIKRYSKRNE